MPCQFPWCRRKGSNGVEEARKVQEGTELARLVIGEAVEAGR